MTPPSAPPSSAARPGKGGRPAGRRAVERTVQPARVSSWWRAAEGASG